MDKLSSLIPAMLFFLFCCLVGCNGQSNHDTTNQSEMSGNGKTVWFYDPWLQMNALKIETPADWKAACDIVWDTNNPATPCRFWLKAASGDNTKGMEVFPMEQYTWSQHTMQYYGPGKTYLGSVVMQPMPALDFLQQLVIPKFRGSVQQLTVMRAQQVPMPQQQQQLNQYGMTQQFDAAEVVVTYINAQGKAIEELFTCALQYTVYNGNNCIWLPLAIVSKRMPKGASGTESGEVEAVIASLANNPQWISTQASARESIAQGARQTIINTSEAARRYAQQGAKAREAQSSVVADRQAATSRVHENWGDVLSGQERFVDPSGNEHVVDTYRAKGWINGLGQTVYAPGNSTYNPNYDPSLSGNFERMENK